MPTCRTWQLSVPTTGFTHSDHFQPGSKANRAAVVSPMWTTSTRVLSGVRVSSGESKLSASTPAIAVTSRVLRVETSCDQPYDRAAGRSRAMARCSERDVVVRAAARADRGALEVRGVGRHIGARLERAVTAVTAAARVVRARAQELDAVGDDLDRLALGAVLRLPLAPVEPSLDGDRT